MNEQQGCLQYEDTQINILIQLAAILTATSHHTTQHLYTPCLQWLSWRRVTASTTGEAGARMLTKEARLSERELWEAVKVGEAEEVVVMWHGYCRAHWGSLLLPSNTLDSACSRISLWWWKKYDVLSSDNMMITEFTLWHWYIKIHIQQLWIVQSVNENKWITMQQLYDKIYMLILRYVNFCTEKK